MLPHGADRRPQGHRHRVAHGDAAARGGRPARVRRRRRRARVRRLRRRRAAPAAWRASRRSTAAKSAFEAAAGGPRQRQRPGRRPRSPTTRAEALELLNAAYQQLDAAEEAGYPFAQIDAAARRRPSRGLDRLYGVTKVQLVAAVHVPRGRSRRRAPALVRGSDGAPYVLDTGQQDRLAHRPREEEGHADHQVRPAGVGHPGRRPEVPHDRRPRRPDPRQQEQALALAAGQHHRQGHAGQDPGPDSASWGDDIKDIATFVANFDAAFYKLYLVDPSEQNIMVCRPANDGSRLPGRPTGRLPDRPRRSTASPTC